MQSLLRYVAPPSQCGYLPHLAADMEYELVAELTPAEYAERMLGGWRRFGRALFRPQCRSCQACQPIRVCVDRFRPDRSQRRTFRTNAGLFTVTSRAPTVTRAKLDLYDRYHAYQTEARGWLAHSPKDPDSYFSSFVDNPFPVEEWTYELGDKLVGVGYVDDVPCGLSAVYFYYDPQYRTFSLGIFNVLMVLNVAAQRRLPHVYLGYYVAGCGSMAYKARFRPSQVRNPGGVWEDFLD